jgi:hypothetical protein
LQFLDSQYASRWPSRARTQLEDFFCHQTTAELDRDAFPKLIAYRLADVLYWMENEEQAVITGMPTLEARVDLEKAFPVCSFVLFRP